MSTGSSQSGQVAGLVAVSLAACGFGFVSVVAKRAFEAGSEPTSLLATRLAIAGLVLAPFAGIGLWRVRRCLPWGRLVVGWAGGAAFAAAGLLEFEGLDRLSPPVLVVLVFLAPVWVAIGSKLLWGRRIGRRAGVCLALVLFGSALLVGWPGAHRPDTTGVVLAVTASVVYAGMFILIEDLVSRVGAMAAVGLIGVGAASAALSIDVDATPYELSNPATRWYAGAVGVVTAGSLTLLAAGMRTTRAFPASVIAAAEPVAASLMAWILLGDLLTISQALGALAILSGAVGISATGIGHAD